MTVLGAVAVPPAVGAAGLAVASLGALIAFIVAWGLAHGWAATFGYLIQRVANWTIHVASFSATPFHALIHVDTYIRKQLDQFQAMSEHAMVYTFGVALQLATYTATTVAKLAEDTYHGITHRVQTVTHTVTERITHTVVKPITKTITATTGITRATYNVLAHRVSALEAHVRAIAHAIPHAIPQVIPRLGRLERTAIDYSKLHKWLSRALLGTLGAAAVATALRALKLGFLRCKNFRRAGERVCGLDPSLLESLLADTLLVVGTLSLLEFAKEMESVTEEVGPLVQRFWRAV